LAELVRVWPNFNLFVPGIHTLSPKAGDSSGPLHYVATSLTYAVAYSALLLLCAALIFRKRDLL
jgi:hypothetical protein